MWSSQADSNPNEKWPECPNWTSPGLLINLFLFLVLHTSPIGMVILSASAWFSCIQTFYRVLLHHSDWTHPDCHCHFILSSWDHLTVWKGFPNGQREEQEDNCKCTSHCFFLWGEQNHWVSQKHKPTNVQQFCSSLELQWSFSLLHLLEQQSRPRNWCTCWEWEERKLCFFWWCGWWS